MRRWLLGVLTVVILLVSMSAGSAAARGDGDGGRARTVNTKGGFDMRPNNFIRSNLRFAPGTIRVHRETR